MKNNNRLGKTTIIFRDDCCYDGSRRGCLMGGMSRLSAELMQGEGVCAEGDGLVGSDL